VGKSSRLLKNRSTHQASSTQVYACYESWCHALIVELPSRLLSIVTRTPAHSVISARREHVFNIHSPKCTLRNVVPMLHWSKV